ncbi:MAG: SWIM zinc finger family protein [Lewinellaceae bacterium]|nr:SWIM zinc finger family protein [Lewinellaceae bacterium]
MSEEQVERWTCTCPYDYGPVCKHVAAALYEVRKKEYGY